jgi:hypothetical protein
MKLKKMWKLFDFIEDDAKPFGEDDLGEIIEQRKGELILELSGLDPELLEEKKDN